MKPSLLGLLILSFLLLTDPVRAQQGTPYVELQGLYGGSRFVSQYQAGALVGWSVFGPLSVGVEAHIGERNWAPEEWVKTDRSVVYAGLWTGASVLIRNRWVLGGRLQVGPEWVNTQLTNNPPGLEGELITDERVRAFFGLQTHGGVALTPSRNLYLLGHIHWLRLNSDAPIAPDEVYTTEGQLRSPAQLNVRLGIGWNFGR
ncbi:MAG TPA: hypothetical protein DCE41_09845 [Cytophagales bacterium]|nr:hypothetical protein [Cytophagales bacterium]